MAACSLTQPFLSRRAALVGLVALAGCGFQPIYDTPDAVQGQFAFQTDRSVAGFRLRDRLEDRLGLPAAPSYLLIVTQTSAAGRAAITEEGDSTRFNLRGTAKWRLIAQGSGAAVETGTVSSFTSYSATGSTVATQSASTDAEARLSVALADLIVSQLLALSIGIDT